VIVLKPQTPGLDTNLRVTTDRRAYYLRLISKAEDYVARVAFAYPDDDSNARAASTRPIFETSISCFA
jgi:type IV secretion system protein VirB9